MPILSRLQIRHITMMLVTTREANKTKVSFVEADLRNAERQQTPKAQTKGRRGHGRSLRTMKDGHEIVQAAEEVVVARLLGEAEVVAPVAEEVREAKAITAAEMVGLTQQRRLRAATQGEVVVEADMVMVIAAEATRTVSDTLELDVSITTKRSSHAWLKNVDSEVLLRNQISIRPQLRSLRSLEVDNRARQLTELLGVTQAAADTK